MRSRSAIRTLAILAFTVWTALCCCERRVLAEWIGFAMPQMSCCIGAEPEISEGDFADEVPACCASKHCAGSSESDTPDPKPEGCAMKGCCDRFSGPIVVFDVPTDSVGVDCVWYADLRTLSSSAIDADDAARHPPPPWLGAWPNVASFSPKLMLVISSRIRI